MTQEENQVKEFLATHSDARRLSSGRILCTRTGHEMPASAAELTAHWNGKRYNQKVKNLDIRVRQLQVDRDQNPTAVKISSNSQSNSQVSSEIVADHVDEFSAFYPQVVEHHSDPTKMYCLLTKTVLNRNPLIIRNHLNGRRYVNAVKKRDEAELKRQQERERLAKKKNSPTDEDQLLDYLENIADDAGKDGSDYDDVVPVSMSVFPDEELVASKVRQSAYTTHGDVDGDEDDSLEIDDDDDGLHDDNIGNMNKTTITEKIIEKGYPSSKPSVLTKRKAETSAAPPASLGKNRKSKTTKFK